jgi:hypothetical protein
MVADRPGVADGASRPPSIDLACPPRFGTQRNLSRPTLGPAVGAIARRLGMPLMPWQQHVADVALELDPDGSFHYDEVILSLPRQNGKSALVLAWIVHRLIVAPIAMGRQRVTYTAQLRQKARAKLEKDWAEVLRQAPPVEGVASFTEILNPKARPQQPSEWKLSLNNGSENIQFGRGNFLQLDAPSRTGGHGDTLDVGVIDEAWVHEDNTVETGMSPSMATRINRQFLIVSAAGEARSKYFYRKVRAGRRACVAARPGRTAYFEWSALALDWDPDKPDVMTMVGEPGDPATWRACMPALGITISERFVEGEWAKAVRDGREGIELFCRSYLNMWMEVPVLEEITKGSDLPVDAWLALADPGADRGTDVVFGVDIGTDRLAHVAVAWRRPDGRAQVMLADRDLSPLRTAARLRELQAKWQGPVVLGGTSAPLEEEVDQATVISSAEFAAAVGRFEDLIESKDIRHGNQPELNKAVEYSELRPYGSTGARTLQLRDAPTAPPLAAVLRALAGLTAGLGGAPASPKSVSSASTSSSVGSSEPNLATMEF